MRGQGALGFAGEQRVSGESTQRRLHLSKGGKTLKAKPGRGKGGAGDMTSIFRRWCQAALFLEFSPPFDVPVDVPRLSPGASL